jgi:hypothetical protein
MAKIPLPERGQPLDVTYIYQLADAINSLSTEVSSAVYKNTTVETASIGKQTIKTSESRIVAGYKQVANNTTVSAGNEIGFSYDYGDFKYPPIASVTPVNIGGTQTGQNAIVILKSVTTSRLEGTIKFNSSGEVSMNVHILLVGIPN